MGGWGNRVATKRALEEKTTQNTGLLLVLSTILSEYHGGKVVISDEEMQAVQGSLPSIGVKADKESGTYTVWLKRDGHPEEAPVDRFARFWNKLKGKIANG
jgi:hypothetical protein